jgi:hypothetical protein
LEKLFMVFVLEYSPNIRVDTGSIGGKLLPFLPFPSPTTSRCFQRGGSWWLHPQKRLKPSFQKVLLSGWLCKSHLVCVPTS